MTREHFLRGYLLLTAQPWGKAYRTMQLAIGGEPSPAELQVEFYYKALELYHAEPWRVTCEQFAAGDHWPSIDQLKQSLKHTIPARPALPPPQGSWVSMEEALNERPDLLATVKKILA